MRRDPFPGPNVAPTEEPMEFGILGPLEVRDAGRVLPLRGTKQRALLALLLLNANQVVSSDRLIDELWGDEPPDSGTAALQVRVSKLRKALGGRREGDRDPGAGLRHPHRIRPARSPPVRATHVGGRSRFPGRRRRTGVVEARRGARALARRSARRPRVRVVRAACDRPSRGAPARRARAANRSRARARPAQRARRRARGAASPPTRSARDCAAS